MNALDEPNPNQPGDLVIFDGVCNLCEASVNFIMRHDKDGVFRFVPSQSELGGVLQRQYQIDTAGRDTVVLIRDGQVFTESDAAVRIAAGFDGWRRLLGLARNGRRLWGDLANRATGLLLLPGLWGDLANRPTLLLLPGAWAARLAQEAAVPITLTTLFLSFLKIGSVLYGSGYVLVAFLQSEFVERLGWISSGQLLDAVAIGQFTPGPVFTTATFIGYQVAGVPGAVLATVGIFLPGFVFVAITNPFIPRMRRSPWLSALLDGVVAASLGLMAAVTVELARQSIVDVPTALLLLAAAVLLIRFRVNSTWLILGGAAVGLLLSAVHRTF